MSIKSVSTNQYLIYSALQVVWAPLSLLARIYIYANSFFHTPEIRSGKKFLQKIISNPELLEDKGVRRKVYEIFKNTLNPTERKIFKSVKILFEDPKIGLQLFLQGANFKLEDEGFFYKKWANLEHSKTRKSSHNHVKNTAKSTHNKLFKEFLFYRDKDTGHTHFQMEKYPAHIKIGGLPLAEAILHLNDYFEYKKTGHQIGPFGRSPYTDKHPVVIERARCSKIAKLLSRHDFFNRYASN